MKGETGWTYWVYDRTPALVEAVAAAVSNRSKRKEEMRERQNRQPSDSQNTGEGLNGEYAKEESLVNQ